MPTNIAIPQRVIAEDHRLEKQASTSSRALMEHRWHWTIDESNPKRVSFRVYARFVGRKYTAIQNYARGYTILLGDRAGAISADEARERANMGSETAAATEAVAKAKGVELRTASRDHATEVRRVRDWARERAEKRGTTVEEQVPKVMEAIERHERAAERHTEYRKKSPTFLAFSTVEGQLDKARRALLAATKASDGIDFDREERELLAITVDNVRRLLELLDRAIVGKVNAGWRDELRVIEGQAS